MTLTIVHLLILVCSFQWCVSFLCLVKVYRSCDRPTKECLWATKVQGAVKSVNTQHVVQFQVKTARFHWFLSKVNALIQCSTLHVAYTCPLAHLPGATKNFNRVGKISTVVAWSGNNELCRLLHLNLPSTLVVNMFTIKKYHNTIVAKIAMLEICSFVDHKLAVFTYIKYNFSPCTSQCCDQQKLSNLACSVKLKDWTQKWNVCVILHMSKSVKQSKVNLVNRQMKIKE